LIPLATIIFIVGRELLMDAVDIDGDRAGGIKTIPMMFGVARTCRLSFALMFLGACALLPLVVYSFLPINILLLSIVFASLIFMSICWKLNSRRFQRSIIIFLWLPMLCGMAMLLT
jgi:geranylgeranylglycerol-phosphate geranylgeranyltransferase